MGLPPPLLYVSQLLEKAVAGQVEMFLLLFRAESSHDISSLLFQQLSKYSTQERTPGQSPTNYPAQLNSVSKQKSSQCLLTEYNPRYCFLKLSFKDNILLQRGIY